MNFRGSGVGCYGLNCPLPSSYIEALSPIVIVFGDEPFGGNLVQMSS